MRVGNKLLAAFYTGGKAIRRERWPAGDYISADGAEGGTIWYYDDSLDELAAEYRMDFHDLGAADWTIIP